MIKVLIFFVQPHNYWFIQIIRDMTNHEINGILKNYLELNEFSGISYFIWSDGDILSTLFYKYTFSILLLSC